MHKEQIKNLLMYSFIIICIFYWSVMIIGASLHSWIVYSYYNTWNEGYFELFFALTSLPLIIWYLIDEVKEWKK